jgi:hypothetical protein
MSSPLHQMTMSFSAEDDRLLLRLSTRDMTEYQLWLTRRFFKVLWRALIQILEKAPQAAPKARGPVMAVEHMEAVQTAELSRKHDEGTKKVTPAPELIIGGTVKAVPGGLTRLVFNTKGGLTYTFTLNKKFLHLFLHLTASCAAQAKWDLETVVGSGNVVIPADPSRAH